MRLTATTGGQGLFRVGAAQICSCSQASTGRNGLQASEALPGRKPDPWQARRKVGERGGNGATGLCSSRLRQVLPDRNKYGVYMMNQKVPPAYFSKLRFCITILIVCHNYSEFLHTVFQSPHTPVQESFFLLMFQKDL